MQADVLTDVFSHHLQADMKHHTRADAQDLQDAQADGLESNERLPEHHGKIQSAALVTLGASRLAARIPGLRRLPVMEIVLAGQVVILAREHIERLTPRERHRVVVLCKSCHCRPSHLSERDHAELNALIAKVEPRLFAETALRTLSPLPIPRAITRRF